LKIILSTYDFDVWYKPLATHANADGLLRLPLNNTKKDEIPDDADAVCVVEEQQLNCLPISQVIYRKLLYKIQPYHKRTAIHSIITIDMCI